MKPQEDILSELIDQFNDGQMDYSKQNASQEQEWLDIFEQLALLKDDTISYPQHLEEQTVVNCAKYLPENSYKRSFFRKSQFAIAAALVLGISTSILLYGMYGVNALKSKQTLEQANINQQIEDNENKGVVLESGDRAKVIQNGSGSGETGMPDNQTIAQHDVAPKTTVIQQQSETGKGTILNMAAGALELQGENEETGERETARLSQRGEKASLNQDNGTNDMLCCYVLTVENLANDTVQIVQLVEAFEGQAEKVEKDLLLCHIPYARQDEFIEQLSVVGSLSAGEVKTGHENKEGINNIYSLTVPVDLVTVHIKLEETNQIEKVDNLPPEAENTELDSQQMIPGNEGESK